MLVKVMVFPSSPCPPPNCLTAAQLGAGPFTPAGPDRACEHLVSRMGGALCALGARAAHSKGQETQW